MHECSYEHHKMDEAMDTKRIQELMSCIDGSGSDQEWTAVRELRCLGLEFPKILRSTFHASRSWRVRSACVYHAMRYARESEDAVALGISAIADKAKGVRYRGAMLLAYSQRKEALPALQAACLAYSETADADDLAAAIDAIQSQNHHYFLDRAHTGNTTWEVD